MKKTIRELEKFCRNEIKEAYKIGNYDYLLHYINKYQELKEYEDR